jgi:hypothetical protein
VALADKAAALACASADGAQAETSAEAPAKSDADADADVELDNANDEQNRTTFKFYVRGICGRIAAAKYDVINEKTGKRKQLGKSAGICQYLSDIVIEFIQRVAPLILLTATTIGNKTISVEAVHSTIKTILLDGQTPVSESIHVEKMQIPDPKIEKQEKRKHKLDETYVYDAASIPLIDTYVVSHTVVYSNNTFEQLKQRITDKLELLAKKSASPAVQPAQ